MSAIDAYLANNAKYSASFSKQGLPAPPSKEIAVVTCMDARLETGALLGLAEGEAHVIRNAGGVVTDDVIRSLTVSQRKSGTREIMLIHHTDCAMLKFTDAELTEAIEQDVGMPPPFQIATFTNVEDHLRLSLDRLKASPFLVHKDAIRGFIYEVETGKLREV
jgi:carbonic anhydrase